MPLSLDIVYTTKRLSFCQDIEFLYHMLTNTEKKQDL